MELQALAQKWYDRQVFDNADICRMLCQKTDDVAEVTQILKNVGMTDVDNLVDFVTAR